MLAKPPGKGMRHLYDLIVETNEMVGWNINSITAFVLSQIYPLRSDEKVIEQSILNFSDRKYHHISVSDRVQIHYITKGSGLTAHMNISRDEVKLILPFSDAIVDAVVTRKDEVRRLLNLRREFVDIPDSVRASDFIDIKRFNYLDSDYKGNPVMRNIGDIKLLMPTINRIWIDFVPNRSYNKYNKPEFSLNYAFMSKDWLFVLENYDVLMELFTKILDWYPKTYQKQLKIRNAILSIEKTVKMEGKLLE